MTHKMSSCMNSHCWLRPRIPVLCVCFGLVVVVFFVCLLVFGCFWFGFCLFGFLLGLLPGLRTSTTSTFVAFDELTALHVNYNSSVCRDWMCVTTWRKPWRRWTEKKSGTSREEHCATSLFNLVSNCFFSVQCQMALARSRKDNCILGSIFQCPLGMRVCKHSLVGGGDLVPHCDSAILEAGMPIRSVELHPYGQTAFEQ